MAHSCSRRGLGFYCEVELKEEESECLEIRVKCRGGSFYCGESSREKG